MWFSQKCRVNPRHSMYAIYAYIGVVWGVNVGIYGIYGVSGNPQNLGKMLVFPCLLELI